MEGDIAVVFVIKTILNFSANLTILPLTQVSLGYWIAVHPILVSRGLVNSAEEFLIFAMPGDTQR